MPFHLTENFWRAEPLERFEWLEHGFGTRPACPPEAVATLRQIHSDIAIDAAGRTGCLGDGDALLSRIPGTLVGVKTADCLPILLVDTHRRAVAAVHAGWRGTHRQIVRRTVDAMARHFDTQPEYLHAAIGPGIGICCYEVGPEVAAQFQEQFPERTDLDRRTHLDLREANRRQLRAAGLSVERIYTFPGCTMCYSEQFHSYRRDGATAGRMLSVVGIRP